MISAELKFEGFDVRSWTNLVSLFSPAIVDRMESSPVASDDPVHASGVAARREGTLLVVVDDQDRLLKSFHTSRGRVRDLEWNGPETLPALAESYAAARVVVLRDGVMDEISERLALRLQRGDDYVTQWLALARIIRELLEAKMLHLHPRPLAAIPVPTPGTVRRALDVVLPDDRSLVVVLWDHERPWTSVAVRRRKGAIDRVAGPDLVARWVGPLGGDFRRDHRVIVEAVSRALAPVHVGIFSEVDTLRELLRSPGPGAWARAVAVRDVVVHPMPAYVAMAVGADGMRGVTSRARRFLGGIDVLDVVSPITELLRSRVAEVASVRGTLGFDPLEALSVWLRRNDAEAQGRDEPETSAASADDQPDASADGSDPGPIGEPGAL